MATSSRSAERFKYGICLNDECSKCKTKEVQQISMRKELVCSECGKPLRECPPPPTGPDWKKIGAIIAAVVVVGGVGCYFAFGGSSKEPVQVEPKDSVEVVAEPQPEKVDSNTIATIVEEQPIAEEPKVVEKPKKDPVDKPKNTDPGQTYVRNANLGYGTYTGEVKPGTTTPHGHGTMVYKSTHKIAGDYTASPGDKYEGEFRDGRPSGGIGYWTHDGNMTTINP